MKDRQTDRKRERKKIKIQTNKDRKKERKRIELKFLDKPKR